MNKKQNTIFWLIIAVLGIVSIIFFLKFFINQGKKGNYGISKNLTTISFDTTTIDLDSVIYNNPKEVVFSFTNTGSNPLLIHTVLVSCGCTLPIWDKKPVLHGKTGNITVIYNASDLGFFRKSITVVANTTPNQINLTIQGEVKWE